MKTNWSFLEGPLIFFVCIFGGFLCMDSDNNRKIEIAKVEAQNKECLCDCVEYNVPEAAQDVETD